MLSKRKNVTRITLLLSPLFVLVFGNGCSTVQPAITITSPMPSLGHQQHGGVSNIPVAGDAAAGRRIDNLENR